jgi:hypothetical protein
LNSTVNDIIEPGQGKDLETTDIFVLTVLAIEGLNSYTPIAGWQEEHILEMITCICKMQSTGSPVNRWFSSQSRLLLSFSTRSPEIASLDHLNGGIPLFRNFTEPR